MKHRAALLLATVLLLVVVSSNASSAGVHAPSLAAAPVQNPPPISWGMPAELKPGRVGQRYEHSLCAPKPKPGGRCGGRGAKNPSGGLGHYYIFSLHLSRLPPGLSLSSRSGILSGTPKKAGSYRFTVCAQEAEASRTPGIKFQPACDTTRLRIDSASSPPTTLPTTTTPLPPPPRFAGSWNGSYSESLTGGGCTIPSSGTATGQITQTGNAISGTMTFAGGWVSWYGAPSCQVISREDWRITFTGTVDGETARITYANVNDGRGGFSGTFTLSGNTMKGTLTDATFSVGRS